MTPHSDPVVLIGPMGSGKTSIGKKAARALGVPFFDTDAAVVREHGPIERLFAEHGEEHFRSLEKAAVARALAEHDGVLALGGGAVLDAGTRAALEGHRVVFLSVGLADAVKRVGLGVGRPLLLGNVRARIKALLDERLPIYRAVATVTVETDGKPAEEVADEVAAAVEELEGSTR